MSNTADLGNEENFDDIARWIRKRLLEMTTSAGSGHLTSSLSSVELMVSLFFGGGLFQYDFRDPGNRKNDRLLFSKGHASPLYYAMWAAIGAIDEEDLKGYRSFGSSLEGHPSRSFLFTEVPTGSLGQGLAAGMGEALADRLKQSSEREIFSEADNRYSRVWVLLGDSELAEGSIWETARIASHYRVGNLFAIVDVNRLGQRGETMDGWDTESIRKRFEAFGWFALCVDGHSWEEILSAYKTISARTDIPSVIIAKTVKGKGVSFLENQNGWHGKTLAPEMCRQALEEIGETHFSPKEWKDRTIYATKEVSKKIQKISSKASFFPEVSDVSGVVAAVAPRKAYGISLVNIAKKNDRVVALDAEVGNSTYALDFAKVFPDRFFEMFVAEQTMASAATGFARRGYIPFISTFSAFFSRAFDQIRMAQYAEVPLVCVGSHPGVSIGEDGPSQMGLEDIAMFRSILESVIFYPSDAVSFSACLQAASEQNGIVYIRTTRADLPVLYGRDDIFSLGGSKTLRESDNDSATIVSAGITLHEAIKAYDILMQEGIAVRVVDLYSIKPIDTETLQKCFRETQNILVVEDHYPQGGIADAVREALSEEKAAIVSLSVFKKPKSGSPSDLLRYEEIDAESIVRKVRSMAR